MHQISSLFTASTALPPKPQDRVKRYQSSSNTEGEEACARKKEWTDLETVGKASMNYEETRQIRAR